MNDDGSVYEPPPFEVHQNQITTGKNKLRAKVRVLESALEEMREQHANTLDAMNRLEEIERLAEQILDNCISLAHLLIKQKEKR
jgi:ribonuclease PH